MTLYANHNKVCVIRQNRILGTGLNREITLEGTLQRSVNEFTFKLPDEATDLDDYVMNYAFADGHVLSADFSSLKNINGSYALDNAFLKSMLGSVDFSSLETINGERALSYGFYDSRLTSINFPSLSSVTGSRAFMHAFYRCRNLRSVSFPRLITIGLDTSEFNAAHFMNAFDECNTRLTSISFPELTTIYCTGSSSIDGTFFSLGRTIKKIYLPKLTTITHGSNASSSYQEAYKLIFSNTSFTEIHFGAANQETIESNPGYATLWGRGSGNATVYFDL